MACSALKCVASEGLQMKTRTLEDNLFSFLQPA